MAIDMKKMRRSYDENQRGGDLWNPDTGLTLLYIHGMCRDNDEHEPTQGLNHVPVVVHYGLGKDRGMALCLDAERNPIIQHPFVKAMLKKRKIVLKGPCPVCKGIKSGSLDDDTSNEAAPQTRFLWGVTPIAYKPKASSASWSKLTPKPSVAMVGSTMYNGFMDMFFENGDITDPEGATFVIVSRTGKGRYDTKYKVKIDPRTLKKPRALPAALRRALAKAMDVEGDCDLFRIVANMVKSHADVKALLAGVKVETSEGDDIDDEDIDDEELDDELDDGDDEDIDDELEDGDDEPEGDDDEPEGDDDDDLLDEDDEDDASEDSDDDAGDDMEDDEDEPEADEDAEGDDDLLDGDDDDLMDDDEEPEPAPKSKAKAPAKKAAKAPVKKASAKTNGKAKAKPAADDEDDLGLDELDAELERASKRKKSKAKSKSA